jgi:hypothetical protein
MNWLTNMHIYGNRSIAILEVFIKLFFGGGGAATPCASPPPRPPFFLIILFAFIPLFTGMTNISLQMQWPPTSQSRGFSKAYQRGQPLK